MNSTDRVIPGSQLAIVAIAATAGTVATHIKPATSRRGRLLGLRVTLVCDATVATRNIQLVHQGSSNHRIETLWQGSNTTAGQTKILAVTKTGTLTNVTTPSDTDYLTIWFPIDVQATQSAEDIELTLVISNGQAGDSYSGYYLLEDWAE